MIGRIVEVSENGRHLSLFRGFLIVQDKTSDWKEMGRIPLDDILAVIAHSHGLTYTNNLLVELAKRNIPFVLSSDEHEVVGMLWPVDGHQQQAKRFDAQIAMSLPKKKSLWADIVKLKIKMQIWSLSQFAIESKRLERLSQAVRSGDPENIEGQAARIYWKLLFGEKFVRDRQLFGINTLLNYGYTVFRSSMARAVIAAGLHPSIGLHHSNDFNAMRLVDDLLEPFRPIVDVIVKRIVLDGKRNNTAIEIGAANKRLLVQGLFQEAEVIDEAVPVTVAMQKMALSLAKVALKEQNKMILPDTFRFSNEDFEL